MRRCGVGPKRWKEVSHYADKYRRARDPKLEEQYLQDWHFEQRILDIVNDVIGPRYKAKLENRSCAEGASREGKALDEMRQDRALRAAYIE